MKTLEEYLDYQFEGVEALLTVRQKILVKYAMEQYVQAQREHFGLTVEPRLKKYIVFAYEKFYPSGGFHDLYGSYDTIEEIRGELSFAATRDGDSQFTSSTRFGSGYSKALPTTYDKVDVIDRDTLEDITEIVFGIGAKEE